MLEIITSSAEKTQRLAETIAPALSDGDILCFFGDLGSGKTTFIQGLAQGMKVQDKVDSPSFIIINTYPGERPLYHIDLYRIEAPDEAIDLGIEEYLDASTGICAIEWAENMGEFLPEERLDVKFEWLSEEQRSIKFSGPLADKIEEALKDNQI